MKPTTLALLLAACSTDPSMTEPGADPVAAASTQWAWSIGGSVNDRVTDVAVDEDGNVYSTGFFSGSLDLGCGRYYAGGGSAMFLAKHDAGGVCAFTQIAFGAHFVEGSAIAIGPDGGVAVAGRFDVDARFPGVVLSGANGYDGFVSRWNPDGRLAWARAFGGTSPETITGVAHGADAIWVTGTFTGESAFAGFTLGGRGGQDGFLATFGTGSGDFMGASALGGAGTDAANAVASDGPYAAVVAGSFESTATFGGVTKVSAGAKDLFAARFESYGAATWAARAGGSLDEAGLSVAVDSSGHVVVGGYQTDASSREGGLLVSIADGTVSWGRLIESDSARITAVTTLAGDDIVVAGDLEAMAFAGGMRMTPVGAGDLFVARYDAAGFVLKTANFGGTGHANVYGVAAQGETVTLAGAFTGTLDSTGMGLTSAGAHDGILISLETN